MSQTIAIYLRVSSKSQDVASQEPELRRWAAQQEGEVRWYRDRFTGKTMERPAFTRLLRHVRSGEVQQVAVWRLDRLGRTAKGLTALFDELTELNVRLVSLRDGLDLSTAAGRLMANVLASVAAYETEVRAERILAGQAAARAKGKTWGGSEKGRRIKVNDEQIRLIHRMKAEGEKVAAIARATGLSRPTIYDVLKTEPALQKN
ncbi:MAG: recombinase family protein [Planctomycetota bacterium]|nr:recombinase family protein [Planctomycetota bacterium]